MKGFCISNEKVAVVRPLLEEVGFREGFDYSVLLGLCETSEFI